MGINLSRSLNTAMAKKPRKRVDINSRIDHHRSVAVPERVRMNESSQDRLRDFVKRIIEIPVLIKERIFLVGLLHVFL